MNRDLNLHLLQWEVISGDVDGNLVKAEELLKKADPREGDLIVLPEMFPSGFFYEVLDDMAMRSDEVLGWMSDTARRYRTGMAGSLPTRHGEGVANTMVLMNAKGEILACYDKVHLFPLTGEDRYFVPGDRVVTATWEGTRVGLAICFDLRFPELTRRLCAEGVVMVLVSAQWPMTRINHFRDLVRVRAMENQMFVAACNSCGKDGSGMVLGGGSMIADPSGRILGTLGTEEGVLSWKISLEDAARIREEFPVVKCRREDLFGDW